MSPFNTFKMDQIRGEERTGTGLSSHITLQFHELNAHCLFAGLLGLPFSQPQHQPQHLPQEQPTKKDRKPLLPGHFELFDFRHAHVFW